MSMQTMSTRIDAITEGIYRISTFVPDGPPGGITFNQFLVIDDEPLLFHTGTRRLFPAVCDAVASVIAPDRVRWISSCHASRPDEYGALGEWMELAPRAKVAHGYAGCFLCLTDVASRTPHVLADGEMLSLGSMRMRWLDTPHMPGPWEAGVMFEETTATLFCGDVLARTGPSPVSTQDDVVEAAIAHEELMHGYALTPSTGPILRRLADLEPRRLALMHGPTFEGDSGTALRTLANYFDNALHPAEPPVNSAERHATP